MRHVERHAMPLSRFALLALLALLSAWPGSQVRALNHVSQAQGNLLLDSSHGNGEAWGKANCSGCHHLQRLHRSVPKIKAIVDQKKFATCTGCHGSNGSNALRQCLICHNGNAMPLQPLRGGKHRHDFSSAKDFRTTSKQCVICHQAADMDGRFELERDLTLFNDAVVAKQPYANISEFCLRCHNPDHQQRKWPIVNGGSRDQSRRAEDHYRQIDAHGLRQGDGDGLYNGLRAGQYRYGTVVDCTDCHTMHGTHNPSLLIEDSRQGVFLLDKTIRGQGYKVDVTGGNVSDLCVLCHNMSIVRDGGDTPAGTGLSGVHFNGGDNCLLCHNHGEEVQKGL